MSRQHVAIFTAGILIAAAALAAPPPDWRKPTKDWPKGPVRWLLTEEEEKQVKAIKADEERATFVKAFWEKRDPTPGTPVNEFEVIFWKKVEEATKGFESTGGDPGWVTDRGRVFLLLGNPTKMDTDARGRIIWTFEPSEATGIKEKMTLTFARSGQAILLLDRKALETYVGAHPEARGIGWKLPPAPEAPTLAAAPSHNPEEDLSPESKRQIALLEEILARNAGPRGVPFQTNLDYYAAADGTTLTVVTVEIPRDAAHGADDSALKTFARFAPESEGKAMNVTGPLPFVPAADPPAASYVYQARRNLAPGRYRLAVVVEDKIVAGQSGAAIQSIEIPDFSGKDFAMSNISLLAKFGQIESGLGPDDEGPAAGPFVMGSFRLVPRAYATLTRAEALAFYYQVYHPSADPATGQPSLEITYAFFEKDGDSWKPFRKPVVKQQRGQVELFAVDMKDFLRPNQPLPAEFRMEAKIVDLVAKQELKRDLTFTVR